MSGEELLTRIAEDSAYTRGRLDAILPKMQETLDKHGIAIQKLENKENFRSGVAATISAVVSVVISVILPIIKNK